MTLSPFPPILWIPLLALISGVVVFLARKALVLAGILDVPNARSNHKEPVARGGGIAVMALLLGGGWRAGLPLDIVVISAFLTIICFIDDVRGLSAKLKLGVQLLMVLSAWYALPVPDVTQIVGHLGLPTLSVISSETGQVASPSIYVILFGLLFIPVWVWWVNASNFMDGIDGISGVQGMTLALGILLIAPALPELPIFMAPLAGILLAVLIGFLWSNWHPAKIFLGDCGSVPMGFITGFMLWKLAANDAMVPALLLPAYSILDATGTLLLRAWRREKLLQPHSAHAYQRAVRRGMRHDQVVVRIAVLDGILLLLSVLSLRGGWVAGSCLVVGYAVSVALWLRLGGGWAILRRNPEHLAPAPERKIETA